MKNHFDGDDEKIMNMVNQRRSKQQIIQMDKFIEIQNKQLSKGKPFTFLILTIWFVERE